MSSAAPIPIAQGPSTFMSFTREVTKGVTPSTPPMKLWRSLNRNINVKKTIAVSNEIRSDGQVADLRHGMNSIDFSIQSELAAKSYDDQIEDWIRGTWAAVSTAGTPNQAVTASSKTFTRASGNNVTDGFRAGDIIIAAGFTNAGNNGLHLVTAVTSTTLVVASTTLVDEATAASRTISLKGKRVSAGTQMTTYTGERGFSDLVTYEPYNGLAINNGEIRVAPETPIMLTLGGVGMGYAASSGTSLGTPSVTDMDTQIMMGFDGALYEAGVLNAVVTTLTFNTVNGRSLTGVVGSHFSPDVFEGTFQITGSMSAFFTSQTLRNKFLNETESSLYCKMLDPDGNFLHLVVPRLKYTGNEKDPPREGGVVQNMPFQGLVSAAHACSFSIQRSNT